MKRTLLVLLALGAAAVVVHALSGPARQHRGRARGHALSHVRARQPVDWPAYGFDAARTHAAPFALAPPFTVLWKQPGDWSLIEFPPIAVGGRLYVGTNHGLVLALDAATGRIVWRRQLSRCIASSPAAVDGLIVVGVLA
ncbi:MAG TPA: PQQ-binding-like beta-propeller repeat protein, partial [Mycobacteriales bacterium]|nr:PQQ-binding-like beta-propeller repeat protein [Mycobacteriales bacterium]